MSWLVIFERLRQADAIGVFIGDGRRPKTEAYWRRLQERLAYSQAILENSHPLIEYGRERIVAA